MGSKGDESGGHERVSDDEDIRSQAVENRRSEARVGVETRSSSKVLNKIVLFQKTHSTRTTLKLNTKACLSPLALQLQALKTQTFNPAHLLTGHRDRFVGFGVKRLNRPGSSPFQRGLRHCTGAKIGCGGSAGKSLIYIFELNNLPRPGVSACMREHGGGAKE
ncbi:hypothetical protein KM043_005664 [Ampulex compressa]|nr:hypothetical protein KM043_005664 [Ampulex compressa]